MTGEDELFVLQIILLIGGFIVVAIVLFFIGLILDLIIGLMIKERGERKRNDKDI